MPSDAAGTMKSTAATPQRAQTEIDALAAPRDNGEILIWPNQQRLFDLARDNRRLRESYDFDLGGKPAREWLASLKGTGLIYMTGHQPDFFHPGVWAKSIAAATLARQSSGRAMFLLVDSDVPERLALSWPDVSEPYAKTQTINLLGGVNQRAYEQIRGDVLTACVEQFKNTSEAIHSAMRAHISLDAFERAFVQQSNPTAATKHDFVDHWVAGVRALDNAMGVSTPDFVRSSDLFAMRSSDKPCAASAFVVRLVLAAEEFARVYNAALANYRRQRGIHGIQHPIPDLAIDERRIELPFWLLSSDQPRRRLFVSREANNRVGIWAGDQRVGMLDASAIQKQSSTLGETLRPWQIRPRALTQTMFARLLACDLFIHGIGGAKYDQITDEIVRSFFRVEPPKYACISASLHLPLPRYATNEDGLRQTSHRARDVHFNPQRYIHGAEKDSRFDDLLHTRERLIDESQRLRTDAARDTRARKTTFDQIQQTNAAILKLVADVPTQMETQLAELSRQLEHNKIADAREWFYALYSPDQLRALIADLNAKLQ